MKYYFIVLIGCFYSITFHAGSFQEIAMTIRANEFTTTKKYLNTSALSKKEYYNLIQLIAIRGDSKNHLNLIKEIYKILGELHIKGLSLKEGKKNLVPYREGEKIIAHIRKFDRDRSDIGYALIHNNNKVFSLLMEANNKEFLKKRGCDLAQSAVILGRTNMLKMLLDHDDVLLDCTIGFNENSIWHTAAIIQHHNSVEIFKMLQKYYEKKTNETLKITMKNNSEETPLMSACGSACRYLRSEIVSYLLEQKSDPNALDVYGNTPLHRSALWECPKTIQTLLAYGANPNSRDVRKQTPLHIACDQLNVKSSYSLINHKNVLLNSLDDEGESPLHLLLKKQNLSIFDITKRKNIALFLTSAGAQWDIIDKKGRAPIHYSEAAALYKEKYLKRIMHISKKFDWSLERSDTGDTLLHLLVKKIPTQKRESQSITDSIQFLLEHNALLTHKNKQGETPLTICKNMLESEVISKEIKSHYAEVNLIFSINQLLQTSLKINLSKKTRNSLRKSLNKE